MPFIFIYIMLYLYQSGYFTYRYERLEPIMAIKMTLAQKQIISQKMIQSVNILQMSSLELTEYIKEVALENPVVDFPEEEADTKNEERIKKLEWLASLDEQNRSYYQYDLNDVKNETGMNNLAPHIAERLEDNLRMQLINRSYSDKEQEIFDYIIQCLDSRGFFTVPVPEVAMVHGVSEQFVQHCIDIMRSLEPAGVCAANVQECLLTQLGKRDDCGEIERAIIHDYMKLLGKNQLHTIAKNLNVEISQVIEAAKKIRELNPKPSQGFDNGEPMQYVVPDIIIVKFQNRLEILLNDHTCPIFHVNKDYLQMLKTNCSKEVKDYLFDKFRQAEEIQACIQKRGSTLMSLAKCIVNVQRDFFMTGENSLKTFHLYEAAEVIGCHESTVSRALKDKYLQCCWGIYPLSFFFPKGLGNQYASPHMTTLKVKEKLKEVIEQEDKEKPYSDKKITELLNAGGIDISRRTVVKYREEMNIPNSRGRKNFF